MKKKQTQHNLSNLQCDTSTTLPTAPLNLRFSYRSTLKLSAFEFHLNAQEFQADVPLPKFNCYDACYNKNMATDICFGTLHPSIWKTIWSLYNMLQSTVKGLDNFFIIDFKRFLQYLSFCTKTNKFSRIDMFNHILLTTKIFCKNTFLAFWC